MSIKAGEMFEGNLVDFRLGPLTLFVINYDMKVSKILPYVGCAAGKILHWKAYKKMKKKQENN